MLGRRADDYRHSPRAQLARSGILSQIDQKKGDLAEFEVSWESAIAEQPFARISD